MEQHALTIVITVGTILLSIIGTLIIVLGKFFWGALKSMECCMNDYVKTCAAYRCADTDRFSVSMRQEISKIEAQLLIRAQKHDELAVRVFEKLDDTKDKVNDLSETVAGFSGIYVTRQEILDLKSQLPKSK